MLTPLWHPRNLENLKLLTLSQIKCTPPRAELFYPLTRPVLGDTSQLHDTCPGGGMVDALASGASVRMDVEVRVLSWAPFTGLRQVFLCGG